MSTHVHPAESVLPNHGPADSTEIPPVEGEFQSAAQAAPTATLEERQKAYLLQQLLEAPEHTLALGDANKKINAAAKRELRLELRVAKELRDKLVQGGHIRVLIVGRTSKFTLTDEGRIYLQGLPHNLFPPPKPRKDTTPRTESEVSEQLLPKQQAFLLLMLLQAPDHKLTTSILAGKLRTKNAAAVGFDGVIARPVMLPLLEKNYVTEKRSRSGGDGLYPAGWASYRLTEEGTRHLFTLEQYPSIKVSMSGEEFNKLIAAFRQTLPPDSVRAENRGGQANEAPPQLTQRVEALIDPPVQESAPPVSKQLNSLPESIRARFNELLHEKYAHAGMVPIHELRAWVAEKFGREAASHAIFDAVARELQQQGHVRFVTITDLRDGTPEQLGASIRGINETFFYMEPAHEQSFNF